jgi:hypothetical protein
VLEFLVRQVAENERGAPDLLEHPACRTGAAQQTADGPALAQAQLAIDVSGQQFGNPFRNHG